MSAPGQTGAAVLCALLAAAARDPARIEQALAIAPRNRS
jgi:hypothetical protein